MTAGRLDRLRNTRFVVVCRIALVVVGVSVGAFQLCDFLGLRFNTSPSLPVGLYIVIADSNANLVEFCPAEQRWLSSEATAIEALATMARPPC